MAAWLAKRDFDEAAIDEALRLLVDAGALDDARFARLYAEDKRELSGWGEERIRAALAGRGVEAALTDAALAGATSDAEAERGATLLRRRGEPLDGEAARGRALAYLARRGFPAEVAYEAVRQAERADRAP